MTVIRLGLLAIAAAAIAGCSVLHLGESASGVKVIGRNTYCGTPSQASAVHYFASPNAFQNWIDYRDISGFNPNMARNGVLIVEMGERPTGGYRIDLDGKETGINNHVLTVGMDWHAPRLDAAVSQALISECVALHLPQGNYNKVKVVDQLGNTRGTADLSGTAGNSGS